MRRARAPHSFWHRSILPVVLVSVVAACSTESPTLVPPPDTGQVTISPVSPVDLQRSVVQVQARVRGPEGVHTAWQGSGTIVSPDGLVLTNAHVAQPSLPELAAAMHDVSMLDMDDPDALVIAVVEREDEPPVPRYTADVVAVDGMLDLAVLRISGYVNGRTIGRGELELHHVPLGDSDALRIGDPIQVFGFPGLGGETITLSYGGVSGFVPQELIGMRAWVKTDTAISPGSSGGLGADAHGQLIAIPTQAALLPNELNLLRPASLAVPLVQAAQSGDPYVSPYRVQGTGNETLTFEAWASDVNAHGCADGAVDAYPPGSTALHSVFAYTGMADGQLVFADWTFGGRPLNALVWFWDVGTSGPCFPLSFYDYGRDLDAGTYSVQVRAGENLDVIGKAVTEVTAAPRPDSDGVQVVGVISDAESGAPISGAVLIVYRPGISAGDWSSGTERSLDAILTVGESDNDGRYRLLRRLERGVRYEVAADHPEYIQLLGEFVLDDELGAVHVVDIELSR